MAQRGIDTHQYERSPETAARPAEGMGPSKARHGIQQPASRGQVTPFVILAILIIVAVGALYYTGNLSRLFGPLQVAYPTEVEPVARFIQDCAKQTGTEAVIAIAGQGGYITLPSEIQREYDSFMPLDDLNLKVLPHWIYRGTSRIPTIPAMERQISEHVTNRTKACLQGFRPLSDRYIVTEVGNLSVATTLTTDTVYLRVNYPIKVVPRANLKETRMEDFSTTIPARLKKAYQLAVAIMRYENNKRALENLTIDLMSSDPDIPLNHLGIECKQDTWKVKDIQSHLQESLAANLLNIRIKNTDHAPFEADPATYEKLKESSAAIRDALEQGTEDFRRIRQAPATTPSDAFEYFHSYWDVGTEQSPMTAAIIYRPEYGMDLTVAPSADGAISSTLYKASRKLLSFICLNTYHFTYTIRYPVRVAVFDPQSFDGKGLAFEFAIPVTISNNAPEDGQMARRFIADIRPSESFCAKVGTSFYEIRAIGSDEEGFTSNAGLDEVNISYRCAGRLCSLGTTSASRGSYALITPMPSGCKNPSIIAAKDGYLQSEGFLDTKPTTIPLTIIPLTRLKAVELEVRKAPYFAFDKKIEEEMDLADDENVTLTLQALGETRFETTAAFPSANTTILLPEKTTDYRLDAMLTKQGRIIGGYHASNITLTGRDVQRATRARITVIEYRPTPITDADEASMALYLMAGPYRQTNPIRLT